MRCPDCGARAEVLDSRPRPDGGVRRRRECTSCELRFTTFERAQVVPDELAARVAALALHLADYEDVAVWAGRSGLPHCGEDESVIAIADASTEALDGEEAMSPIRLRSTRGGAGSTNGHRGLQHA